MSTTTRNITSPATDKQRTRPSWTHRIGVIVAGSLAAGLLVAALLALGVFGGAAENVVGG